MNKSTLILSALILLCIGGVIWNRATTPKIAFVRSGIVLKDYLGMKEAAQKNDLRMNQWQANIDTLSMDMERSVRQYQEKYSKLSSAQRQEEEQVLKGKQDKLEQYKATIGQKAQEEQEKLTQGVLNQINSFIEQYAKEHGYDIVLGVTGSGNILYGTKSADITSEIVEGLNNAYKGK